MNTKRTRKGREKGEKERERKTMSRARAREKRITRGNGYVGRSGIAARLLGSPGPGYFNTNGGRRPPTWGRARGRRTRRGHVCVYPRAHALLYRRTLTHKRGLYIQRPRTSPARVPRLRARPLHRTVLHDRSATGRENHRGSALRYSGFLRQDEKRAKEGKRTLYLRLSSGTRRRGRLSLRERKRERDTES